MAVSGASVGVGGAAASDLRIDGDRLCLCRYEADRGGCGRPVTGDRGPSSLYEELRLITGLFVLVEEGDWDAGVYGIASTWGGAEVTAVGCLCLCQQPH